MRIEYEVDYKLFESRLAHLYCLVCSALLSGGGSDLSDRKYEGRDGGDDDKCGFRLTTQAVQLQTRPLCVSTLSREVAPVGD